MRNLSLILLTGFILVGCGGTSEYDAAINGSQDSKASSGSPINDASAVVANDASAVVANDGANANSNPPPTSLPVAPAAPHSDPSQTPAPSPSPNPVKWLVRDPRGTFGPVSRAELDEWAKQGRLGEPSEIQKDGGEWIPANTLYPTLVPPPQFEATLASVKKRINKVGYTKGGIHQITFDSDIPVTNEIAAYLPRRLKKLETLRFDGHPIKGETVSVLVEGCPNLKSLALTNIAVGDVDVRPIARVAKLEMLDLSGTKITDAGVQHLAGLVNLVSLNLGGTNVTDMGAQHLALLSNLDYLSLEGTQITNAGIQHLKGLTSLQSLDLSDTTIDDTQMPAILELESLKKLSIRGTKISKGAIVKAIATKKLTFIAVDDGTFTKAEKATLRKDNPVFIRDFE